MFTRNPYYFTVTRLCVLFYFSSRIGILIEDLTRVLWVFIDSFE